MNSVKIKLKPISVNKCWRGRRFKTDDYIKYERNLLLLLPKMEVPSGKLEIKITFGLSSKNADWDNPVKPFQDVLQKKYGFNDSKVYKASVEKVDVKKGEEFIEFGIKELR